MTQSASLVQKFGAKGLTLCNSLPSFSHDLINVVAYYAFSGLQDVLLPTNVITVTDDVSGLIQIYTLEQFDALFRAQSMRRWFVWSHRGWTQITLVQPVVIDVNNAGSEFDKTISKQHGWRRSCFVVLRNNQNLLQCWESANVLQRTDTSSSTALARETKSPLIVDPPTPDCGLQLQGKTVPAVVDLVHGLADPACCMLASLSCDGCERVFAPGEHFNHTCEQRPSMSSLCDGCLTPSARASSSCFRLTIRASCSRSC